MKLNKKISADIIVVLGLASFTLWYLLNAWSVSSQTENLILIMPIAIMTLIMCCLELIQTLFLPTKQEKEDREPMTTAVPIIGLFTVYVLSLEWLGFDIATIIFIAAFLFLQGERRWHWVSAYSISFGVLVTVFFSEMLPYPMPMLLLPTDY